MNKMNKKVLIVEDDKDFLWILKRSFENKDIEIVCSENGEEGLLLAEKEKPGLIIIDIGLPKMDGITMAKKIKEKGIKSQIIFLTNLKDAEHVSEALSSVGATDYIVKSDVHIDDIVVRVKNQLGMKS